MERKPYKINPETKEKLCFSVDELAAALGDGEDYELLFSVPAERRVELENLWPLGFAPLGCIGRLVAGEPGVWDGDGTRRLREIYRSGYEH